VRNQMSWFIYKVFSYVLILTTGLIFFFFFLKGSPISENKPIRHRFYRTWDCHDSGSIVFHEYLYFSSCGFAPQRQSKGK
jgi:hypothetical protein